MTRRLRFIAGLLFAVWVASSACQPGGGAAGIRPPGPAGSLPVGVLGGTPSGGSIAAGPGTMDPGATPPGASAAAGGGDTMPPRADAGDCMTHHLDGTVYCGPELREACRVSYVPAPKMKVMASTGSSLPPIPLEGKASLNGRFYAEIGSAPLSCEDTSCWTWEPIGFGDAFLMRLTRLQPSAPALQFHQDMISELTGEDGANLMVTGTPVKNEDVIEFYATLSEARPEGYSETLVPLTDDVWTKFGIKCEMGGFRIDTGTTYERKPGGVTAPGLDDIVLDRVILKK